MGHCVLVVDDHPINLKLACDVLESSGYTIESAANATQALDVVKRATPHVILMDVALPGMDGLTLTRMLKADPATRHIPIVALTASAMKGDDRKAFAAGCNGYIAKPIDIHKLPGQVAEVLEHGFLKQTGEE